MNIISFIPSSVVITNSNMINHLLQIRRLEAKSNYTKVYLAQGKTVLLSQSLCCFQDNLSCSGNFIRVHRSHLVNTDYIKSVCELNNCLILDDDSIVEIARSRKRQVLQQLTKTAV